MRRLPQGKHSVSHGLQQDELRSNPAILLLQSSHTMFVVKILDQDGLLIWKVARASTNGAEMLHPPARS